MSKNKWFFILCLFLGLEVAGQAIYYFIGGESYKSSALRGFLVVLQLLFGFAVAFYGWKQYRLMANSNPSRRGTSLIL